MATKVFINFPVKDLNRSKTFFEGLGFCFNDHFTDTNAACMVISDTEVCDAHHSTEVIIALDAASADEVKQFIRKAESLGGKIYAQAQDHGWMYQHCFADLDGHKWEMSYLDMSQLPQS